MQSRDLVVAVLFCAVQVLTVPCLAGRFNTTLDLEYTSNPWQPSPEAGDSLECDFGFEMVAFDRQDCRVEERPVCEKEFFGDCPGGAEFASQPSKSCNTASKEVCTEESRQICTPNSNCRDGLETECTLDSEADCIHKRCKDPSKRKCAKAKKTCKTKRSKTCREVKCSERECREVPETVCTTVYTDHCDGPGSAFASTATPKGGAKAMGASGSRKCEETVACRHVQEVVCEPKVVYECVYLGDIEPAPEPWAPW